MKKILSLNEVIEAVATTLQDCDGAFVESIANQVLAAPVAYTEDSLFEQESEAAA